MKMERRALTAPLEVRAESRTIAGYAAVFNSETDIGGQFRETIAPGAFKASLASDVRALFDHDSSHVLGRTKAGTLRLTEDERGLAVEIDLPDTQAGRDLRVSMERGDIDGMSFGFRVTDQEWDERGDIPLRTIRGVELFEVSVVTFPAYADTEVALRSLNEAKDERQKAEYNAAQAKARIAARRAASEQKFRGIKPE
jgi:HK97 family phage prohead protease